MGPLGCKGVTHSLGCSVSGGLTERKLKMSSQKEKEKRDFCGGPVVKTPPCKPRNAGTQVLSLVRELRCHVLQSS